MTLYWIVESVVNTNDATCFSTMKFEIFFIFIGTVQEAFSSNLSSVPRDAPVPKREGTGGKNTA